MMSAWKRWGGAKIDSRETLFLANELWQIQQAVRGQEMGTRERAVERRKRIVAHRAANFKDAEKWDLEFWQSQSPEQRLSVLVEIRRDVEKVRRARLQAVRRAKDGS